MRIFTDEVKLPCFLDFEASGLGTDSFPIEVAWSLPDARIECHLICPTASWISTGQWDHVAEGMHRISIASLRRDGRDPLWICEQMNAQLSGQEVFCDGLPFDAFWLQRLFEAGATAPTFSLASLQEYCFDLGLGERQYEILSDKARKQVGGRAHRADVDVRYLIEVYRMA